MRPYLFALWQVLFPEVGRVCAPGTGIDADEWAGASQAEVSIMRKR
jgi:hypothetical protein